MLLTTPRPDRAMRTEIVIDVKEETVEFFGEQGMSIYNRIMNVVAYSIMREMKVINAKDMRCETVYLEVESYLTGSLGDQIDKVVSVAMMVSYEAGLKDGCYAHPIRVMIMQGIDMNSEEMKALNGQIEWLKNGMTEEAKAEWYRLIEDEYREQEHVNSEDVWASR